MKNLQHDTNAEPWEQNVGAFLSPAKASLMDRGNPLLSGTLYYILIVIDSFCHIEMEVYRFSNKNLKFLCDNILNQLWPCISVSADK